MRSGPPAFDGRVTPPAARILGRRTSLGEVRMPASGCDVHPLCRWSCHWSSIPSNCSRRSKTKRRFSRNRMNPSRI
nr:hypothetical protein EUX21_01560 [synthetic Caulobacter sp. 'ethensis']